MGRYITTTGTAGTVVKEVNALPTVILPVEFRVSEPLLAEIVVPPKVMFPPEICIPLTRESELPP